MSEAKTEYTADNKRPDHPARQSHAVYTEIGDLATLFSAAGIEPMTRGLIMSAALRCLRWYIRATQAQGWTLERIWRDVNGGK